MSEKRFTIKSTATELELYDNGVKIGEFPHYEWVARPVDYVVKTLNEQQATIEMYQRRVHKREEQISIIKKHCLKFLTDEQFETIRKELENE